MSNFPLSYKLSWLPRFVRPSLGGSADGFAPASGALMDEKPAQTVRLAFVGDISAVANREPPEIGPAIREVLARADLVVGNCESPVVERPRARFGTRLGLRHAMTPAFLDGVLAACGIDPKRLVLSLANNHALDQGVAGFDETVSALSARGIAVAGIAGSDPVLRVKAGPLTLGLIAFTEWRNAGEDQFAGRVTMLADIAAWQGGTPGADLVAALPHWDLEFRHFPRAATRALAKELVRKGIGLIAGHHAHVLQPVERLDDALVAYGLGDLLGTALPRQPWPARIGAVLLVDVGAEPGAAARLAAYRLQPFFRMRDGHRERLVDPASLAGRVGGEVQARLAAIFGNKAGRAGGQPP